MNREYPIIEFDPTREAILEPHRLGPVDVAEHCVLCFFQDVLTRLVKEGRLVENPQACCHSEMGRHPVYEMLLEGRRVAVAQPGLGAPFAAGCLEELIAFGCRKFIVVGGAGVLDRQVAVGHAIVPTAAIRDEGTSYHYLPPSREVAAHPHAVVAIEAALQAHRIPYLLAKTWTTDAIYRETAARAALRKKEGCLTVEMEAAALFAVSRFRGTPLGQILYAGDLVCPEGWDARGWNRHGVRESLLHLAAEACLRL